MTDSSDTHGCVVICFDDDGEYVLAPRRAFASRSEADKYASTIAQARWPMVVGLPLPTIVASPLLPGEVYAADRDLTADPRAAEIMARLRAAVESQR